MNTLTNAVTVASKAPMGWPEAFQNAVIAIAVSAAVIVAIWVLYRDN